ncbi:hypothetical protein C8F01DRAFT_1234713 [Mycena amicta]|nr:hypothetical protein C8F01DRAFT_1234713 [Mycena amicta]
MVPCGQMSRQLPAVTSDATFLVETTSRRRRPSWYLAEPSSGLEGALWYLGIRLSASEGMQMAQSGHGNAKMESGSQDRPSRAYSLREVKNHHPVIIKTTHQSPDAFSSAQIALLRARRDHLAGDDIASTTTFRGTCGAVERAGGCYGMWEEDENVSGSARVLVGELATDDGGQTKGAV